MCVQFYVISLFWSDPGMCRRLRTWWHHLPLADRHRVGHSFLFWRTADALTRRGNDKSTVFWWTHVICDHNVSISHTCRPDVLSMCSDVSGKFNISIFSSCCNNADQKEQYVGNVVTSQEMSLIVFHWLIIPKAQKSNPVMSSRHSYSLTNTRPTAGEGSQTVNMLDTSNKKMKTTKLHH